MNTLAIVFFSLGSAFASFALGIVVDCLLETDLTDTAKVLLRVVAPLCGFISASCFALGIWALVSRRSELRRIREESNIPG